MPTIPTFWLNDVFGKPPNTAATAVPRPSAYVAPDTSSSVHIANEGGSKAEVRATMITEAGLNGAAQQHSEEVVLGFVPANSLVKFTQTQLADAFGITAKTKLSVTFNIDALPENVSAYATVQNAKGRTEVSNSQQIEGNDYPSK